MPKLNANDRQLVDLLGKLPGKDAAELAVRMQKAPSAARTSAPPIPYEPLAGRGVIEPVLEPEVHDLLKEAIAPLKSRRKWELWGMDKFDAQGTTLLFTGPSGTGKTTAARWLAKEVSGGMISITMADVGGGDPGDTERGINRIFDEGVKQNHCTIFVDECDGLLWSRDKAGPDSMWMLSVVNGFLQRIEKYKGLTILATNHAHVLDPALLRRITETIQFEKPSLAVRRELWLQKLPKTYPININNAQLNELAKIKLTGSEIERAIVKEARVSLRSGRNPQFPSLLSIAGKISQA